MLQRKKKEMKQIHNVDEEVAVGADDEKTIYDDNVEIANKQIKKQCREVDKRTIRNQVQLPHSTIKIKKDFHEIKKNSENELIIPSLSPMPSCSWSLHEELTSSDTGYNSEIVRSIICFKVFVNRYLSKNIKPLFIIIYTNYKSPEPQKNFVYI